MNRVSRATLFGLPLDLFTLDETVAYIMKSIRDGERITQMSLNAPKVLAARQDQELRAALIRSDLVTADGSWVALAARLCGIRVPERFGGVDLFEALLRAAADQGRSVFFFGATEDVVARVAHQAKQQYPTLTVAGIRNGFFDAQEANAISSMISQSGADLLFLGFPSPRKETWLDEYFDETRALFAMGVGGSFDVFAGDIPRAPRALQRIGLEWLWRMKLEPRRLWRRYLETAIGFAWLTLGEMIRLRLPGISAVATRKRAS